MSRIKWPRGGAIRRLAAWVAALGGVAAAGTVAALSVLQPDAWAAIVVGVGLAASLPALAAALFAEAATQDTRRAAALSLRAARVLTAPPAEASRTLAAVSADALAHADRLREAAILIRRMRADLAADAVAWTQAKDHLVAHMAQAGQTFARHILVQREAATLLAASAPVARSAGPVAVTPRTPINLFVRAGVDLELALPRATLAAAQDGHALLSAKPTSQAAERLARLFVLEPSRRAEAFAFRADLLAALKRNPDLPIDLEAARALILIDAAELRMRQPAHKEPGRAASHSSAL